jgi:hypothetical protein
MSASCARLARERLLQAQAVSILTMRSDYKYSATGIFRCPPITWLAVRSQLRRREKSDD